MNFPIVQRPEFEQNGVVYVNNVLISMLPSQLRSYIESYMQKVDEKDEEIGSWLSENDLPADYFKSDIMKTVLENLEEDKEVDVEDILSILPESLEECIREYMQRLKVDRKIEEIDDEIDFWLIKIGIPESKKWDIKKAVQQELNKDVDTDVENFLSTVEWIQEFIPFNRLKKVKILEVLDESVLKAICKRLEPEKYDLRMDIIREGQPLQMILFVEGFVWIENERDGRILDYSGDFWGEELLVWPSSTSFPAEVPLATDSISNNTHVYRVVTALVLTADDMVSIGSTFRAEFDRLTSHWLTRMKKEPKLESMDDEVLKSIFLHLKERKATYFCIENQPLESMNLIIERCIQFTRDDDDSEELVRREGEVYGEELLEWVLDTSFPALTPLSTHTAYNDDDNAAVVLSITAEKLKSVGSKFRSYFSTFRKESRPDLLTFVGLTMLKIMPELKTMDEEVLKAISQHIKLERNGDGVDIITGGEPLDRMLFVLRGNLVIDYGSFKMGLAPGQFFGEELVDRLARCSDATRPLSNHKVATKYFKDTELLVLMANDLESVASQFKFKSHFS